MFGFKFGYKKFGLKNKHMKHLQARGCILVASSPEILTRVKKVISRDLAHMSPSYVPFCVPS